MSLTALASYPPLDPGKFRNPSTTAKGEARAEVALGTLERLGHGVGV